MKFVNLAGVKKLLSKIKEVFVPVEQVDLFEQNTSTYVLDVDYSKLEFDTSLIIGEGAPAVVGLAIVGQTTLQ
jgi:hypothetical protein